MVNEYSTENPFTPHIWGGILQKNQYSGTIEFFLQKHFNLTDFVIKAIVLTKVITAERDIKGKKRCSQASVILLRPPEVGRESQFKEGILL